VKPIPILIEPPIQIPMGVISTSEIECVSMAEGLLKYTLIGILVVVIILVIFMGLHRCEYINMRAAFGCTKETERFKALKESPFEEALQN
jgi:fumarate reductase subunit D